MYFYRLKQYQFSQKMNAKNKFTIDRLQIELDLLAQKKLASKSKYILLYNAIKQSILKGDFPYNWHLPSTRTLASELDLSRTTVLKAFELLLLEKLITAKPGSGNYVNYQLNYSFQVKTEVSNEIPNFNYPEISEKGKSYLSNISLINRLSTEQIAFRPGLPPLDVFPINQWKKLLNIYWRYVKSSGLSYSQGTGIFELKKSICDYLNISRNIKCEPEQIVVVSGSLQSLFLISSALIDKDDEVIVENPLFPNVHSVFKSAQAKLHALPLDEEGIAIKNFDLSKNKTPKLVHVTPTNHYPLGVRMSLKRRTELLKWCSENGSLIIENDYENEIANYAAKLPTIFSLDKEDRTIYMGTFNRLLHPSIRIGYMIVPKFLMATVNALQEHSHRFISPSIQVVMNQFIEKNYLYQHINNTIEETAIRYELFCKTFAEKVKTMHLQEKAFNSFHVVAFFNQATDRNKEAEIIEKLSHAKVAAFPLSNCYVGETKKTGLIFGYAAVRPNIMLRKIQTMSEILSQLS